MAKILGRARIKVDGVTLKTKPGARIRLGGTIAKPVNGHEYYGPQEETQNSELDCVIYLQGNTPVEAIRTAREVTIVFETDVGKSYVITGASLSESVEITDGEGEMTAKFIGPPAVEKNSAVVSN